MTTKDFIRKYQSILNIRRVERQCKFSASTISRCINSEDRYLPSEQREVIKQLFSKLAKDLKDISD